MKKCKYCGEDNSLFCTGCGKPVSHGNLCPHCGASVSEGDTFCQNCGKNVKEPSCESHEHEQGGLKSGFKKYIVYVIGGVLLFGIIGYFSSNGNMTPNELHEVVEVVNDNCIIADYDENKVYPGEYIFDAVMTDAALNKKDATYTMKIDGNRVSVSDGEMSFMGDIDNELKIVVGYDPNDGIHAYSITLTPNDREGKEWKGEWQSNAIFYNVTLTLKECRQKGEPVKITQERNDVEEPEEVTEENTDWLQGHWVYEQGNYKGHFIIRDNTLTQYSSMNPERFNGTFRIEGDEIRAKLIDGMDLVAKIDYTNQRIDYGDGQWMHKISSESDGDNANSTDTSSTQQRPFSDEQDILARIYNQRFRHSSGLEIRIDGYGRIEIDGDPAGVVSVIRYNSEGALLRYGNGMYGEGKILLKIDGNKLLLQDTADGSVFYQR